MPAEGINLPPHRFAYSKFLRVTAISADRMQLKVGRRGWLISDEVVE